MVGPIQSFGNAPPARPTDAASFAAPAPAPAPPPPDPRTYLAAPAPPAPEPRPQPLVSAIERHDQFVQYLKGLSGLLDGLGNRLDFDVVSGSNQLLVRIVDRETGAVIRQVPAPEVIEMKQRLEEGLGGFLDANV